MSTYSPSLRIELITTGDQAGVWGSTTNNNMGTLIEAAIAGYESVSITSAAQALTALSGLPDQSRNMVLALTTTTTAAFAVYAPPVEKTYIIYNASAYAATVYNSTIIGNTTAAGVGVVIPAGRKLGIWSDGTNFAIQNDNLSITAPTGSFVTPAGTTAQRDAVPLPGFLRYNSTLTEFEGYNGTAWASVGGATISNDTATATNLFPLFASATSGTALAIRTSNAKLLYKPSTGELQSSGITALNGLVFTANTLVASTTVATGYNASSVGPFTVPSGLTVTVSSGSRWVVI